MKKPTNPSKVIIIPQTPQNNNSQGECPQGNNPAGKQEPAQAPAQKKAEADEGEEEAE